jgi:hypothetical protein
VIRTGKGEKGNAGALPLPPPLPPMLQRIIAAQPKIVDHRSCSLAPDIGIATNGRWTNDGSRPSLVSALSSLGSSTTCAIDLARRFRTKITELHEDDPRAALWIERIVELPLAQQQGRLAEAIAEADRHVEPFSREND